MFAASPALIVLLLGGLALRLVIAYVLFPGSGFESDIATFASWALTLGQHGPAGFYANAGFSDYPPAYLYLLWPVGLLANVTTDAVGTVLALVKLPPMLLDLAVGYVIYRLVLGWTWPARRAQTLALVAAGLYLFNPVSFYDSALWGQTDAAGALIMLLGVAALIRGNSEGAAAMAATAALVKPQFGVVLIPLVAIVIIKRHLVRPGSGPRGRVWAPAPLDTWLATHQGWPRLATSLAAALVAFFALALPFGLGIVEYLTLMTRTAGGYAWLSVNAFNMWAVIGSDGSQPLAQSFGWSSDKVALLGPLPAVVIGGALLLGGFLWGTLRAASRDDRWTLLVALAFLAIAFFILPTRVHERYIFPAIAVLPILAVVNGRWAVALLLLSVGAFINLHAILTIGVYGSDNVTSLPFGELFRTEPFIVASALLQTGVGVWAAWQLRPSARTSPDAFKRLAAAAGRRPVTPEPASAVPNPGTTLPVSGYTYPVGLATPSDHEWVRGPSALDWVVARFSRVPLRRDRSSELRGERGGRLDRLDVLVFVVLIVGATTLRGLNLDKPYGMYFDEVYHARTATEFLQRWQYGMRHDIYEFTHPHLAKYAMAWGIRLAGGNEITGTTELGVPVAGATLERRWSTTPKAARNGDRLYVGTGRDLLVYDLATRDSVGSYPIEATALAVDEELHRLYIADPAGALFALDTTALDARRGGQGEPGGLTSLSVGPGRAVEELVVTDVSLIARTADGAISAWDPENGGLLSERFSGDVEDVVALPGTERVVVDTPQVGDAADLAALLADATGGSADHIESLLGAGNPIVVVDAYLDEGARSEVQALIDTGRLVGVRLESAPLLAVAGSSGIGVLDASTLDVVEESLTSNPADALVLVERGFSEPTLYATSGTSLVVIGFSDEGGPGVPRTVAMPGAVRDLLWNEPAKLVHVLGDTPAGGPTVYVVEPHGNAVFIDVPLPSEPAFLLADTQPERPDEDRGELLAIGADGDITSVGIERNAFGWRLPGVLLGALAAGLLYLLARVLFARRAVGLIAAALVLVEGMLFANSRIGMNDVYVSTFVIAAVLLFSPLYLAPRRTLAVVVALVGAGLALGLALAAKWVALYAIGGLLLLVLLRSGLGRVIALVGMVLLTAVLGALAIRPSPVDEPGRNWFFVALMLLLTGLLTAAMVRRPMAISRGEVWLAVVGPLIIGGALLVLGMVRPAAWLGLSGGEDGSLGPTRLVLAGGLMMLTGVAALAVSWLATRFGLGPFAEGAPPPDTSTSGWFRPGWLGGLPWLFTLAALALVPIGVYIISYAPWVDLGNQWGLPVLGNLPFLPSGGDGQTLPDLTRSMYEYHDNLRAEHAASSPWWAWPLDLKPVWFYQERFAGPNTALIYDTGNLVIFWLSLPAMAFSAWAAWRRRSVALAIVVLMWAALWMPWARIDRATFQYHVYTSLPFLILALSYFLAELWHGPGARTWFLARASAALMILGVPLSWLFRTPLCILSGTAVAHPDGVVCAAEVSRTAQLSEAGIAALVVLGIGAGLVALLWRRASRMPRDGQPGPGGSRRSSTVAALVVVALVTLGGVVAALLLLDSSSPNAIRLSSDVLALMGLAVLAFPAWFVMRARDARRFVLGVLGFAVLWMVVWYPNISGLPLPSDLAHVYQGLLPTWSWDFQFAVNTDPAADGGTFDLSTLVLAGATVVFVAGVAIVARLWGRVAGRRDDGASGS